MNSPLYISEGTNIICNLCFHHCKLAEGRIGICGVNQNSSGVLTSLVYGHASAEHIDPIEKKPLFHFAPGRQIYSIGTVGCNFHCPFCQNHSLSFKKAKWTFGPVTNEAMIQKVRDCGCDMIAFTYNEPSVSWLWYRDLAELARSRGVKTVMVTNGGMSEQVRNEVALLIDGLNIDLKCGDQSCYSEKLNGDRETVLRNISELLKAGVWVELTTLLVPGISDSEDDLSRSGEDILKMGGEAVPWHISAYYPCYKYDRPATLSELVLERCEQLREMGFLYVYPGNITVPAETCCAACGTVLIRRRGYRVESYLKNGSCSHCGRALEGRLL